MAEHRRDESVPIEHIRFVGPVIRCVCGRDYVAGYECQGVLDDRRAEAAS
jgi:hypothetical protein